MTALAAIAIPFWGEMSFLGGKQRWIGLKVAVEVRGAINCHHRIFVCGPEIDSF